MDINELRSYRKNLYTDLFTNVVLDRVPVQDSLGVEFLIQYAGKDLLCAQYEYSEEMMEEVYEKAVKEIMCGDHCDNVGELVNTELKREDTIVTGKAKKYPEFKSKYILNFDEYKKEYPPIDERVEPYMRKAYDKYIARLGMARDF